MEEQEIMELLKSLGAIIDNSHFVYASGRHGRTYVNKDAVYPHTNEISKLCELIAHKFVDDVVEVVIAPAIGGVILSQWIAYHLTKITGREVLGVYAEKSKDDDSIFVIGRGYDELVSGKNVLVVEDILTTGGSAKKVVETTRAIGGNVVGLGVLCNRGSVTSQDIADVPKLFALVNIKLESWKSDDCPMCKANIPINTMVGHGKK